MTELNLAMARTVVHAPVIENASPAARECIGRAMRRLAGAAAAALAAVLIAACGGGGGGGGGSPGPVSPQPPTDPALAIGNSTAHATILQAVPADADGGGPTGTDADSPVVIHYKRLNADYDGWTLHTWDAAEETPWTAGRVGTPTAFGLRFEVPLRTRTGRVGYIFHKGDTKDHANADQFWSLQPGANEIWRIEGDGITYTSNPDGGSPSTPGISNLKQARAVWLDRQLLKWPGVVAGSPVKLYWSATGQVRARIGAAVSGHDNSITLDAFTGTVPAALATRFKWVGAGAVFAVKSADLAQVRDLHRKQLVLVQEDAAGKVRSATLTQIAGAMDDLYAAAANLDDLGATVAAGQTRFRLWAPTAQKVSVFTYDSGTGPAVTVDEMVFDASTGAWSATRAGDLSGKYFRYAVEVFAPGLGLVRNLVTDPYSLSLTTESQRSYIADLNSAALKPSGWDASAPPAKVAASPDMSLYELHVRDFSAQDSSVSAAHRGKYLAFTESGSNGMKHLKALADAGLTDVHLLPVFDIASVPESGCTTPSVPSAAAADSDAQQAAVNATRSGDCFNWGYDPWHFTAPEGSYATDAADGARRIVEFRRMVMALHAAGLRVGMDVVYNHTTASGQSTKSVLDRIVPGYYHRLDELGRVTNSTCCDNTATENLMMAKLMSDSVVTWARDYKISSLRFDIMGHQPRSVMEAMKARVRTVTGREVQFIGEGWNFGEVVDGARFVQASLYSLNGSGIGTFNPYVRDAVRGGSPFDSGNSLVSNQGWVNGLFYDPNPLAPSTVSRNDLMWQGDLIKSALAGSIRSYTLTTYWDASLRLEQLSVGGSPAGYVLDPSEVVNYVENHDNTTLFDNHAFKLPAGTSREDRARVQHLSSAIVAFSQGVPYFHAGVDTLRSKSLDRNSYDAGDWFNRLDWTYTDNNFGVGLPLFSDNGPSWDAMRPVLRATGIKPAPGDIAWTRDAFRDLLKIRASTPLLRLRTADDIKARLSFHNTGSAQVATVLMGHLNGAGYAGANFTELVYLINTDKVAQTVTADALKGKAYALHPVHRAAGAADTRAAQAAYDGTTGAFTVPPRTAVVFVVQ